MTPFDSWNIDVTDVKIVTSVSNDDVILPVQCRARQGGARSLGGSRWSRWGTIQSLSFHRECALGERGGAVYLRRVAPPSAVDGAL